MTEPTITCPKCKTEIKLTESLAAPLLASTRLQFEAQLARKTATSPSASKPCAKKKSSLPRTSASSMSR